VESISGACGDRAMIQIPRTIYERMIDHAKKESPLECCGILAGNGKTVHNVFQVLNAEKSPTRYSMSPLDQLKVFEEMKKGSMEMVAVYHSHPQTIPFPSETDVKLAFYPEISSIIISLKEKDNPVMKAFSIGKDAIYPEEIKVIP
jgi:proteasome lid subunit RPN8/RPN11